MYVIIPLNTKAVLYLYQPKNKHKEMDDNGVILVQSKYVYILARIVLRGYHDCSFPVLSVSLNCPFILRLSPRNETRVKKRKRFGNVTNSC